MSYSIMEGSPGVRPGDVAHILIPGRGRDATGRGLTSDGEERVDAAAAFLRTMTVLDGVVVCSGYKSPADHAGERWKGPGDEPGPRRCSDLR
jgi:hypothetical protein